MLFFALEKSWAGMNEMEKMNSASIAAYYGEMNESSKESASLRKTVGHREGNLIRNNIFKRRYFARNTKRIPFKSYHKRIFASCEGIKMNKYHSTLVAAIKIYETVKGQFLERTVKLPVKISHSSKEIYAKTF